MLKEDTNDENWRHSEVMSILMDHLLSTAQQEEVPLDEEEEELKHPSDWTMSPADDGQEEQECDGGLEMEPQFEVVQAALKEIDGVIGTLKALAHQAATESNIKQAYLIERSIADLKDIGLKLWKHDT